MRHVALGKFVLVPFLLSLTVPPAVLAAAPPAAPTVAFEAAPLQSAARALPEKGKLRVAGVPLAIAGKDRQANLELQRFEVFAPKARVVLHTDSGETLLPIPANIYLRGKIEGDPRSRVTLSVLESGEVRGLASSTGRYWLLGAAAGETLLRSREVGELELIEEGGDFRCEIDQMGIEAFRAGDTGDADALAGLFDRGPLAGATAAGAPAAEEPNGGSGYDHTAVIAVETDQEFLALGPIGGNTTRATDYIADLTAYASAIYIDEVQTSWQLGEVSLWQTTDPYAQQAGCGLLELGREWNLPPKSLIPRTTVHMLSGKNTNSGIAWVGVLCNAPFSTSPAQIGSTCNAPVSGTGLYGGAYGFTGGVDGNFNIDNPSVVWDILAYSHEIGHNFNSPHTHCYGNIGGNAASVDNCNAGQCGGTGCYCGATSLPSGCPGSGQGCGTIMSYCHLLSGGLGNITMTLGEGHPFGTSPGRVPARMRDHVVARAAANPLCLAPQAAPNLIFADGFESANIANWN